MNQPGPRFWEIFFEVYEHLPRQGPGNRACAARALGLCRELPPSPAILDLGCGVGGQTLQLAELVPSGSITAVDSHAPSIERLQAAIAARGLAHRVSAIVGDMAHPEQPPGSLDLIWSEGALYNVGLQNALHICHDLLRPGGYLAFTDAVWRKENPPPEIKAGFELDYPTIGRLENDVAAIHDSGFELIGHFTLPDEAWWDGFYAPMEARIAELRDKYANDAEASAILDQLAEEPEMHRRYSDYYAYEFFIARRVVPEPQMGGLIMYSKGSRDPRLITVRRGGTLKEADHRLLALWAAVCAEHVLHFFEQAHPRDGHPRRAIEQARAWARGEITVTQAREAAFAAHAAAREASGAAKEAARATGHAAAVAHMADHELGAAAYAIRAVRAAADPHDRDEKGRAECQWQREQLPAQIRDLVLDDERLRNTKCWSLFHC